jgi:positive regulator of sigma E activity
LLSISVLWKMFPLVFIIVIAVVFDYYIYRVGCC